MQLNYDVIAPLVQNVQAQGRTVQVVFACPVSQTQVRARHRMPVNNSVGSRIQKSAQRSFMYAAQNALSQVIRNMFGYNILGRVASDVTRQTMHSTMNNHNQNLSAAEQKEAIVQAFQTVSSKFAWDGRRNTFVSASALQDALSPFDLQLQKAPIQHNYDKMILSRMLVEMAMADGSLGTEEETFLLGFLDPSIGTIESIKNRPPISVPEFSQVSHGDVRESMLLLVWTLALCDEHFAQQEQQLLQSFAQQLGLSSSSIQTIRSAAHDYILSQALESMFGWGGNHDQYARQVLFELAGKIGVSQQEALMAEARFQRRRGQ